MPRQSNSVSIRTWVTTNRRIKQACYSATVSSVARRERETKKQNMSIILESVGTFDKFTL